MKTALIWILLLLGCQGFAQQTATDSFKPSMKYGKPSEEELAMTTYAPDTSATAVVLYSKCEVRYDLLANNFRILYNYEVKIKVLKSEGASYADIRIPYYSNESNAVITLKESISQLDASAYNMEGGEMVRTKMKRDLVFTERINKQYMQLKFSIPAVREGTVFEYKYQLSSDLYYSINLWEAQRDIPVIFTQYDITIPEYFKFNLDMRGPHPMASKDETSSLTFLLSLPGGQTEMLSCNGRHMIFTGEHLPALRPDNYVWCANDYMSSVYFELRGVDFPGSFYRSFTHTWEEIDQMLLQDEDFGAMLKMRNPYRDEMASLSLDQLPDRQNRIAAIYTFLKQKISWNGQYGLYGNEVKKAVKNGTGSNADINFILMSMLRDAQIPCYPAVMSRKDRGHPPLQLSFDTKAEHLHCRHRRYGQHTGIPRRLGDQRLHEYPAASTDGKPRTPHQRNSRRQMDEPEQTRQKPDTRHRQSADSSGRTDHGRPQRSVYGAVCSQPPQTLLRGKRQHGIYQSAGNGRKHQSQEVRDQRTERLLAQNNGIPRF